MRDEELPPYQRSTRDDDYWLRQCEGFVVVSAGGRVGVVERLRFDSSTDRPDHLVIRAGRIGRRQLEISVDQVEEVIPRRQLIRVRETPGDAR